MKSWMYSKQVMFHFFYYPFVHFDGRSSTPIPIGTLTQASSEHPWNAYSNHFHLKEEDSLRVQMTRWSEDVAGLELRSEESSIRPKATVWIRYLVELYSIRDAKENTVYSPPNHIFYDQFDWLSIVQVVTTMYAPVRPDVGGFVLVEPDTSDVYVVVGDLHGGLHTFVRLLLRWHQLGILDLETMQVREGYRLLFLGDILDRGRHSIELFLTILLLRYLNKDNSRVFMCRGNHETVEQFSRPMATHLQIEKKLTSKWSTPSNSDPTLTRFEDEIMVPTLNSCPSGIQFTCAGQRYFACHGAIPYQWVSLPPDELMITPEVRVIVEVFPLEAQQLLWNDITSEPLSFVTTNRGGSITQSKEESGVNTIGTEDMKSFQHKCGIHFCIRGHQDSCGNAIVLTEGTDMSYHAQHEEAHDLDGPYPSWMKSTGKQSGYVASCSTLNVPLSVFRVLTISTNTDVGRPLTADSFLMVTAEDAHVTDARQYSVQTWLQKK